MKSILAAAAMLASATFASAAVVDVDLTGATSGTVIDGVGASFAGTFAGQTISGVTGSPTGPLSLLASNLLSVAFWNPGVSPGSSSILPQSNNQGPLSILLDSLASALTFTAGSGDGSTTSFDIAFFRADGSLIQTVNQIINAGYSIYSFNSPSDFAGVTIFNNNDGAGLRYQNFSYETADIATIPLPAGGLLLVSGIGALVAARRRKAA
jgi:hypothetical protein